jgi:hypothetical protein
MEPKICMLVLIIGMIIAFSYSNEAMAFIRKHQFAWPRQFGRRTAAHKS